MAELLTQLPNGDLPTPWQEDVPVLPALEKTVLSAGRPGEADELKAAIRWFFQDEDCLTFDWGYAVFHALKEKKANEHAARLLAVLEEG